jgi:hypothetical protein
MQAGHFFGAKKMKFRDFLPRLSAPALCWVLALALLAACAPREVVTPPAPTYPSRVITQDGLAFMVHRLRLPGTRQELTFRDGDAKQWLSLNLLKGVRFIGPMQGGYRQAEILLVSDAKMRGEVYVVNVLLEGSTDLGYWNMPLSRVDRLDLGHD